MFAKKLVIDTIGLIIFGSFFIYVFVKFLGTTSPYIVNAEYNGIKITYINTALYARTLNSYFTFSSMGDILKIKMPTRVWRNDMNIGNWTEVLVNNLSYMLNCFLVFVNMILWIFRFIAYILYSTLLILGMTPKNGMIVNGVEYEPEWFMKTLGEVMENLQLPYV